jgi:hypothetical protein
MSALTDIFVSEHIQLEQQHLRIVLVEHLMYLGLAH